MKLNPPTKEEATIERLLGDYMAPAIIDARFEVHRYGAYCASRDHGRTVKFDGEFNDEPKKPCYVYQPYARSRDALWPIEQYIIDKAMWLDYFRHIAIEVGRPEASPNALLVLAASPLHKATAALKTLTSIEPVVGNKLLEEPLPWPEIQRLAFHKKLVTLNITHVSPEDDPKGGGGINVHNGHGEVLTCAGNWSCTSTSYTVRYREHHGDTTKADQYARNFVCEILGLPHSAMDYS